MYITLASILISIGATAGNPITVKKGETPKKTKRKTENVKKDDLVTVTCSFTASNGEVFTATAGNWFTSAATAADKCATKLSKLEWTIN